MAFLGLLLALGVAGQDWSQEILKHASLYWKVSSNSVVFNLTIEPQVWKVYDWYGVGLKDSAEGSMIDGDFAIIQSLSWDFSYPNLAHMNTFGYKKNKSPQKSTNYDFSEVTFGLTYSSEVSVSWVRELNKGVKNESLNLAEGSHYTLLWAYGKTQKGVIQKHNSTDRGYARIQLSNGFYGNATDEGASGLCVLALLAIQVFF